MSVVVIEDDGGLIYTSRRSYNLGLKNHRAINQVIHEARDYQSIEGPNVDQMMTENQTCTGESPMVFGRTRFIFLSATHIAEFQAAYASLQMVETRDVRSSTRVVS